MRHPILVTVIGAAGLALTPQAVSAHVPNVSADCDSLDIVLEHYENEAPNNRITITIDGTSSTHDFGGSFTRHIAWTPTGHSWSVIIDANRNSGHPTEFDRTYQGTQQPCVTTTTTPASTTTTTTPAPTTTSAPPTITLGSTTTTSPPSSTSGPSTTVEVGIPPTIPTTTPPTQPTEPPASTSTATELPHTGLGVNPWLLVVFFGLGAFCWLATRRPAA